MNPQGGYDANVCDLLSDLFPLEAFQHALAQSSAKGILLKDTLKEVQGRLFEHFKQGTDILLLVQCQALLVDTLISELWQQMSWPQNEEVALVAVGGYGRRELHPKSDVDILILTKDSNLEAFRDPIENFLHALWDTKLEIGYSVRSLDDCVEAATADISVATNLMESRMILGSPSLFDDMQRVTGPDAIWPSKTFFEAKWHEQVQRHKRFDDSSYNLEPNVKKSPGGLRDIQMVGWIAHREFHTDQLDELVKHHFLNKEELSALIEGQAFLWRVRYALHFISERREDRLLFDFQRAVANLLGYESQDHKMAVEHLMKDYYRTVAGLSELNDMLIQLFQETIVLHGEEVVTPLNDDFEIINRTISAKDATIFQKNPSNLLELFIHMAANPNIEGVRAETIRLIRASRDLIDDEFRDNPVNRALFVKLLQQPEGVSRQLRHMKRYGILGKYIPEFGQVEGQMQFDLFHAYTVDEHTLFVVQKVRGFYTERDTQKFPICAQLIREIDKPELLLVAALFHDIGKGRGGDHSELGAVDAEAFCERHGFNRYDTRLVVWLVENHLLLSMTAQKKDLGDPSVINAFASSVRDKAHLDYLYLLTVADICATNMTLWNAWRSSLLKQLYQMTAQALAQGLKHPVQRRQLVREKKLDALGILEQSDFELDTVLSCWRQLERQYFLRESAESIAQQTQWVLTKDTPEHYGVFVSQPKQDLGTEIFIHGPDKAYLFASITTLLDQLGLNIQDARLTTDKKNYAWDVYSVVELSGQPVAEPSRIHEIESALVEQLAHSDRCLIKGHRRTPRRIRQFNIDTNIEFQEDEKNQRTVMDLISLDRPGLLAKVANVFFEQKILLQTAKVTTIGERVEDVLFITNEDHLPLNEKQQGELKSALVEALRIEG